MLFIIIIFQDIFKCELRLDNHLGQSYNASVPPYTIAKLNQYSARLFHAVLRSLGARKKCTNPVHSRDFAVHSFFERYFRILKIWGKIARYLPISRDISPFYPSPADLGWYPVGRSFIFRYLRKVKLLYIFRNYMRQIIFH